MKLVELYVHIYYYTLNYTFLYKIIMHAWRNDVYHIDYTIALYSNCLNPIPHISRGSSVGSALDLESKVCLFEPTVRQYFSSNNVRLLA